MTYEVRLAPQAIRDLRSLLFEKQAEAAYHAAVWFFGLQDAIFSLEEMPHRGSKTPENNGLRHLLHGSKPHICRIIYSIDEEKKHVNIAQIRHGARQPISKS